MGIVDRVFVERGRKRNPLGSGIITPGSAVFGHDDSTFSPTEYGDYIATSNEVYSAISLRARLMSGLNLCMYSGYGSSRKTIEAGPEFDLFRKVNPYWTLRRLLRMDEMAMGLWGESFWIIEKQNGKPKEIWWAKPDRMKVVPHPSGYLAGYLYEPISGGQPIPFKPDEVIWFRYPNPLDEFSALSPLAAARLAADTSSAMMKSNRNLFTQGLQMGGIIVPDTSNVAFSQQQAEDLEKMLESRFTGADKAHRWGVLRFEAQFRAMAVTPKDAEFTAGLNLTLRQVCNAYGVPAPLLNDMEHATLSNAREYERILWTNSLRPDAEFKASEIEEQLLPMFGGRADHCEFDFSSVASLQESATDAWDRERQAIEVGALTINEWRESKGFPPVEWGDVYWAQVNRTPVDGPEIDQPPTPDPTAEPDAVAADVAAEEERMRVYRKEQAAMMRELSDALRAPRTKVIERDKNGMVTSVTERVNGNAR